MALIKCSRCGHQISSKARSCPRCKSLIEGMQPDSAPVSRPQRDGTTINLNPSNEIRQPQKAPSLLDNKQFPPQSEKPRVTDDWYFVTPHGRNGPVTFEFIQTLVAAGQLNNHTKIWKAGLLDWVKFSEYRESPDEPAPQHQSEPNEKTALSAYVWTLSLAPAWGTLVQIIATEVRISMTHKTLDYYAQMWWIVIACNIIVSVLDQRHWNSSKPAGDKFDSWLCLLVPVYIFRRDSIAHAGQKRFWTWIGSLVFSVAVLLAMSSMYSPVSK